MATGQFAVVYERIGKLFSSGSVAALSEGQLLDPFITRRDDDAFEAIVARHGPMVLGVCRSFLHDENDVEDAFQATFLVLVKKAVSLQHRELLGNWLYGVALRVARRARIDAAKRRDREERAPESESPAVQNDDAELRPMIHDEVNRLPESYRVAVLLCFFEGLTHEEAASRLGWPVGTVKGRLARAKDLLRGRLSRRGVTLPAGLLVVNLADQARASVSQTLLNTTVSAAVSTLRGELLALGSATAATVSLRSISLRDGVVQTMTISKLKVAATVLFGVSLISGGGALAYQFGGMGRIVNTPNGPEAVPGSPITAPSGRPTAANAAQRRVEVAREALALFEKLHRRGEASATSKDVLLWQQRLYEASIDAGVAPVEAAKPYIAALKAAEDSMRKLAQSGEATPIDVLNLEFERLKVERLAEPVTPPMPQVGAGMAPAPVGGMMGRPAAVAISPVPSTQPGRANPLDVGRNKQIEILLEEVIPIHFANETPLTEVLQHIRGTLKARHDQNIPIYVDPVGLQNVEKTMASPISLELDDLPARTTLRLMLTQLGLGYRVRDGLIYISDESSLAADDNRASGLLKAQPGQSGMGGMGGGRTNGKYPGGLQ